MEIKSIRKTYSFRSLKSPSLRVNKNFIKSQSTLIGAYFKLTMDEKLVSAIVRVKDKSLKEKTIPVCFKAKNEEIPKDYKNLRLHRNNIVNIIIQGCDPLPAVIIVVAGKY